MAKIYYNDNGTWKVVDIAGGGSGGSIDADTLNGLLKAGDSISIGKTTAGDKVEVKIDPTANLKCNSLTAENVSGSVTQSTKLNYDGRITITNPAGTKLFSIPWNYGGGSLLTEKCVKKIFSKSIVGSGNIDLYVHNMTFHLPDGDCYGRWYSSNNLNLNSLANIKTVFGNTFKLPLFGDVPKSGGVAVMLTETNLIMDDMTWTYSDFTMSDDVKTV